MSPNSTVHEDLMVNEDCVLHGNRLVILETLMREIKDNYLEEIREQTKRTNGRVNEVEQKLVGHSTWIAFLWAAIGGLGTAVLFIISQHITVR